MKPELLLTDDFIEFAARIAKLHDRKKQMTAEIKSVISRHQKEIAEITEEVVNLTVEFEERNK